MRKPYGLVLAGGGAKGAYQLGAWKAFRELGIRFNAISGVSIGAINGALIAQNAYKEAIELWDTVRVEDSVKIESDLPDPDNLFSKKNYPVLLREFIKEKGIDASPTQEFVAQYINEEKIRESGIDYGLIAYNVTQRKPVELFLDDIPEGELTNMVFASAKYPFISNVGPKDEWYLDGGVYDNVPISMLRKRGINRLVIVDISEHKGIAHQDELYRSEIVYIRPYRVSDLGEAFEFDNEKLDFRIQLGYLDTKKAFGMLNGYIFYFSPHTFRVMVKKYGADGVRELEQLALELDIDRLTIYRERTFMAVLRRRYKEYELQRELEREEEQETLVKKIKSRFIRETDEKYPLATKILTSDEYEK